MADLGDALKSVLQVPGLQELLNSDITQQRQMAPVRSGVAQQAANMLPNSAFPGGRPNMAAIQPANFRTPAPSGDSDLMKTLALLGAGGGIGALLTKLLSGNGDKSGASGDIGKLLSSLLHRGNRSGPDSGPASIPGGSSDFNDWAYNTGTFNPEDPRNASPINSNQFPGYSNPMDDYLHTFEPGGSNFSGPTQPPTGGGGDNYGTDWWDE